MWNLLLGEGDHILHRKDISDHVIARENNQLQQQMHRHYRSKFDDDPLLASVNLPPIVLL